MTTTTHRYTRRHRIATGGMGEVWLAHDEILHRDVAVKYLKREYADDAGFRARFVQEARSAAALQHPGIATVYDFGESELEDGVPFLVMEYVEGQPLSAVLADGPLDPDEATDLVEQAATALAAAHAVDLVHRDVKPGNLMVTPDGAVKITDFGIARAGDGLALTETGQVVGTPSYLSPEQAAGHPATPASDVYSLGVVLFECLAGHRPYTAASPVAIAVAHLREPIPELPAEVPAVLADVVRRALAKKPEERYADAGAFAAALAATHPERTKLLTTPVAAMPPPASPGRVGRIRVPRERWPVIVAAVLAALFVLVLVVAALSPDGNETKDTSGSGTPSGSPSVTSTTPATVQVDPAAYRGRPVAEVRAALTALGLASRVDTVANPGGHQAGTVKDLRPTGTVRLDQRITLDVWGPEPTPTKHGDKPGKGNGKGRH